MSASFDAIWTNADQTARQRFLRYLVERPTSPRTFYKRFGGAYGFKSFENVKAFARWLKEAGVETLINESGAAEEADEADEDAISELANVQRPYYFNEERDEYVVDLSWGRGVSVFRGETVRSLQRAYSNDGGKKTINQVCDEFGLERRQATELLRKLGVTHDSLPFTDAEVAEGDAEGLAIAALAMKRVQIRSNIRKSEFRGVQRDANAFRLAATMSETMSEHISATGPDYQPPSVAMPDAPGPYEIIVPLADLHVGKLCRDRFGNVVYNRAEAWRRLQEVTQESVARLLARGRPKSVTLVMLGDGLHIDNEQRSTTKGTAQITDGDAETLVTEWFNIVRAWVDMWRKVAPVTVFVIGGNHDRLVSAALRAGLRGWFANATDVRIEESLDRRQYLQIGKSVFQFLHGDVGKTNTWSEIFAREVPGAWGSCPFRYTLFGHYHFSHRSAGVSGVEYILCPSLSGNDIWELSQGFPDDPKTLTLIVDAEKGVTAIETVRPT